MVLLISFAQSIDNLCSFSRVYIPFHALQGLKWELDTLEHRATLGSYGIVLVFFHITFSVRGVVGNTGLAATDLVLCESKT